MYFVTPFWSELSDIVSAVCLSAGLSNSSDSPFAFRGTWQPVFMSDTITFPFLIVVFLFFSLSLSPCLPLLSSCIILSPSCVSFFVKGWLKVQVDLKYILQLVSQVTHWIAFSLFISIVYSNRCLPTPYFFPWLHSFVPPSLSSLSLVPIPNHPRPTVPLSVSNMRLRLINFCA